MTSEHARTRTTARWGSVVGDTATLTMHGLVLTLGLMACAPAPQTRSDMQMATTRVAPVPLTVNFRRWRTGYVDPPRVIAYGGEGSVTVAGTLMVPCDVCYRVGAKAAVAGEDITFEVIAITASRARTGGGGSYGYEVTAHPLAAGTYQINVVHVMRATYDTLTQRRDTVALRQRVLVH